MVRRSAAATGPASVTRRTEVPGSSIARWTAASSLSQRGGGVVELLGRHRDAGELGEHRAQRAGRLALGRQQTAQIAADLGGQGEQPERFGGGGHVDDDHVPVARGVFGAQRVQQREVLGAGEFGEFVLVEGAGAEQVEGRAGPLLEGEEFLAETVAGVDAQGVQARRYRGGCAGAEGGAQHRFRRAAVGGEQECPRAPAGAGQGGRGGERGAARAAGARDEDDAHAQSFLASSGLGRAGGPAAWSAGPLSTRFFSPASARSMMTFSALRLIMPSIGILTSTVSW